MILDKITFNIKKVLETKTGQIMISIILGLGLATLFKKSCENGSCIVYTTPPKDISKKIYKNDKKCFKFKANSTKCNDNSIEAF